MSLLLAVSLRASPPQQPEAELAGYRADVFALCTESMAGRATGSAGGEQAIAYIAAAMEQIGLRPGKPGSFRLEFRCDDPAPTSYLASTACSLATGDTDLPLRLGQDACPLRFSADGDLAAEVVFAGHGLQIADLGIDDYCGLDVRDKAVLVLRGGPDWRNPSAKVHAYLERLSFQAKIDAAKAHGAAALLLVERDDGRGGREFNAAMALSARGSPLLPALWLHHTAAGKLFADGLDGLLAAQALADGGTEPPAASCRLRPGAGVRLKIRMAPPRPQLLTANVIGMLPGKDKDCGGEMIVVGAHHDHLGRGEFGSMATAEEAGKVHPGADDNASGVAGVLALARRWQQRPAGKRTIVFAAFGAEEFGQVGSHRWLGSGAAAPPSIVAMLDLDMIGRGRSGRLSVYGSDSGAGFHALLERQTKALGLTAQLRDRSSYRSDQNEFLACGIPALLFTTGVHDQYHRPGDVPELVEVTAALRIVDLVDRMLQNLVDGAERPLFVPPQQKR